MFTKQRHLINKKLYGIKPWYFLVIGSVFLVIAIIALRQNNMTMIRLRDAVIAADQQDGDVEKALQDLRRHVYSHMNTNLTSGKNSIKPPIQLKARYDRLATVEQERIKQQNAQITATAEAKCASQFPSSGYNAPRVACVQEYVRANAVSASAIPDALYKFDFVSPRWSPDLAGISLLLSGVSYALGAIWYLMISRRY